MSVVILNGDLWFSKSGGCDLVSNKGRLAVSWRYCESVVASYVSEFLVEDSLEDK
jgi:hypothetical protein